MASPPPIPRRKSGLALCSLLCGLGGLISGPVTGIVAIITGHLALGEIRRAGGAIEGRGMALAGVILGWVTSVLFLLVAVAALLTPVLFRSLQRAEMAQSVNNARQIKLAMDSFAADYDGMYPNDDTGELVLEGGTGSDYSNDYFRQLFITGMTSSESLFWTKGSQASRNPPDDVIHRGGRLALEEILQAGNVHWAYVAEQTNTSGADRPIILDSYIPGTDEFDENLWNRKVIVLRIDGSVKPMRLTDGKVPDETGVDILSPEADAWSGTGENPAWLLKQPQSR